MFPQPDFVSFLRSSEVCGELRSQVRPSQRSHPGNPMGLQLAKQLATRINKREAIHQFDDGVPVGAGVQNSMRLQEVFVEGVRQPGGVTRS
jgi:hypothetical protein